jgi:hypothetical protein
MIKIQNDDAREKSKFNNESIHVVIYCLYSRVTNLQAFFKKKI